MSAYEDGIHNCTIIGQGFGFTKKGTEYFGFTIRPDRGEWDREISLWVNSEPNIERTKARLVSMGWDGEDWTLLNPGAPGGHSFRGLSVTLRNTVEEGFDNFDFPGPPTAVNTRLGSEEELAKKLNRITGKKSKKAAKVEKIAPSEPDSQPVADDEVPF